MEMYDYQGFIQDFMWVDDPWGQILGGSEPQKFSETDTNASSLCFKLKRKVDVFNFNICYVF